MLGGNQFITGQFPGQILTTPLQNNYPLCGIAIFLHWVLFFHKKWYFLFLEYIILTFYIFENGFFLHFEIIEVCTK